MNFKGKKNTSNWEDFTQDFTQSGLNHQKKKKKLKKITKEFTHLIHDNIWIHGKKNHTF